MASGTELICLNGFCLIHSFFFVVFNKIYFSLYICLKLCIVYQKNIEKYVHVIVCNENAMFFLLLILNVLCNIFLVFFCLFIFCKAVLCSWVLFKVTIINHLSSSSQNSIMQKEKS